MPIVFHDDPGGFSRLIIVDNNEISSEVLSIYDFLSELASSPSFHEEDDPGARFFVINVGLSLDRAKMLLLGNTYPAQ